MSIKVRLFCAKCDREFGSLSLNGLCDRCETKLAGKFEAIADMSSSVKRSIESEYGVGSAEEAFVIKKYGKPREIRECYCDRSSCGRLISESDIDASHTGHDIYDGYASTHLCSSCRDSNARQRLEDEKEARRDRKRFDRL